MPPKPWVVPEKPIETPWVSVPGLLTAECKTNENATYLEITVHGNPSDPRVDDITGDLGVGTQVLANWGLHLIDVNLAMGNLVDIVGQQAKAYSREEQGQVVGSFDANHHGVGADERFDVRLLESGFLHPTLTVSARIVEAAGRFDQHVEAHQETEHVAFPLIVDDRLVDDERPAGGQRFPGLSE